MHTLRSEQHKNLVDRVGQQLKVPASAWFAVVATFSTRRKMLAERWQSIATLYGPLLACLTASKSSYDAMVQQVCKQPGRRGMRTDADFKMAVRNDPRGFVSVQQR
eukprot:6172113-Pleurochrysis_carterae.AAC.1